MYKRHKIWAAIISSLSFLAAHVFHLDFTNIAEASITVVSIALAVYIAVPSVLLGSPFAKELKATTDAEDKTRSMLGTLSLYLRKAGGFSIATLLSGCWFLLVPNSFDGELTESVAYYARCGLSDLSFALFAINVFFIALITDFLITALMNSSLR